MPRLAFAVAAVLAGCAAAYDPPVVGDRADVKFQADMARCRTEASKAASRRANSTPQSAFRAVFDSGEEERKDLVTCMVARGHVARPAT